MAELNRPHIIVTGGTSVEPFTSTSTGGPGKSPPSPSNRIGHRDKLSREMAAAIQLSQQRREQAPPLVEAEVSGLYLQFESHPTFDLALDSLDAGEAELRSVTSVPSANGTVQIATVFVPDGATGLFLKRFDEYATRENKNGTPRHKRLVERIADLRLATIRALWTDGSNEYPDENEVVWWEMWLRNSDGVGARLESFAAATNARLGSQRLVFDDRLIVLVHANAVTLATALDVLDDVAELRRPASIAREIAGLDPAAQAEFVEDLAGRIVPPAGADLQLRICVLDSGVSSGHPLLEPAIAASDVHVADPAWSTQDSRDHGTGMAGIALYGDVGAALIGSGPVELITRLESVKILPDRGQNDPKLYGAITANAVALVEIGNPQADRAFVLAVTAEHATGVDTNSLGEPTSWSATLDALAAGRQVVTDDDGMTFLDNDGDNEPRLFIVSAGNVRGPYEIDHLAHSDTETAEDPSQAWNALIVGAYTAFDHPPTEAAVTSWAPLAPSGELSPLSRTSVGFSSQWRFAPDVVLEGGNAAVSPNGDVLIPESLAVVTTSSNPTGGLLSTMSGTSPAAAALANMHANLRSTHPDLWPETHRALLVSSARWTEQMSACFEGSKVVERTAALRRYGWGVPSLSRSQRSADDALTLIAQREIHPYKSGSMREMHLHDLPWPVAELGALGDAEVRMRIALSYFVQPNPSRRGWTKRYQYASHGLRFAVRRATEDTDDLRARINKDARVVGKKHETIDDTGKWVIGPQQRNRGSLHVDEWFGSAADLAARGCIAVYPIGGWWKDSPKKDRSENGVRYSLVVTVETEDVETDLWTPVAQQVGVDTDVRIEIEI